MRHAARPCTVRNAGIIGLALASLALASCGSSKSATPTTIFTTQQLSSALLTAADLGAEWKETQRNVFTTRQPENPSIDPSLWCTDPAAKAAGLVALAGQTGADVEIQHGTGNGDYGIRLQAWSNADVRQYITAVKAAVRACSGATWKDAEGNSYTLQPMTAPKVGDESISWSVAITTGSTALTADATVARFGDVEMVLQGGAVASSGTVVSPVQPAYSAILQQAADKLSKLTG